MVSNLGLKNSQKLAEFKYRGNLKIKMKLRMQFEDKKLTVIHADTILTRVVHMFSFENHQNKK